MTRRKVGPGDVCALTHAGRPVEQVTVKRRRSNGTAIVEAADGRLLAVPTDWLHRWSDGHSRTSTSQTARADMVLRALEALAVSGVTRADLAAVTGGRGPDATSVADRLAMDTTPHLPHPSLPIPVPLLLALLERNPR